MTSVADVVAWFDQRYPPAWAQEWDRVGLVVGHPEAPVRSALCVVDCVPGTVAEAVAAGVDLMVAHHPLLLRGVSSVAATTYQGRIVHDLITAGIALFVAHTNADTAAPGVSDALAARLGLTRLRPLAPPEGAASDDPRGIGRIGELPGTITLAGLAELAATALPATAWGVRFGGDPDRAVRTVAVCGGAGDSLLRQAAAAGVDAYLTADLRHHPAGEHLAAAGPALLDAAHWATERPWLDQVAGELTAAGIRAVASDLDTDPWTGHVPSRHGPSARDPKEPRP